MPASQFALWNVSDPGPLPTPEGRKESMGSEALQDQGLAQSIWSALLFLKVGFPPASKESGRVITAQVRTFPQMHFGDHCEMA